MYWEITVPINGTENETYIKNRFGEGTDGADKSAPYFLRIIAIVSARVLTPNAAKPSGILTPFNDCFGTIAVLKPSFAASFSRF